MILNFVGEFRDEQSMRARLITSLVTSRALRIFFSWCLSRLKADFLLNLDAVLAACAMVLMLFLA